MKEPEKKIKVSVCILTRNSEKTLRRALMSVRDFYDVVVCDGDSTDATRTMAEEFGARVFTQSRACRVPDGGVRDFSCLRNDCTAHAAYDWVLYIDSDEEASAGLVEEIRRIIASGTSNAAYQIPAGIILDGTYIRYSSNYPGYQIRFFNKTCGTFQKPVHERFRVAPGRDIGTLQNPWHYFVDSEDLAADFRRDLVRDMGIYRDRYRQAKWKERLWGMAHVLRAIAVIIVKSIKNYVLHGFRDSYPPRLEWLRIRYQIEIMKSVLRA